MYSCVHSHNGCTGMSLDVYWFVKYSRLAINNAKLRGQLQNVTNRMWQQVEWIKVFGLLNE